jgi:hypothetical protein
MPIDLPKLHYVSIMNRELPYQLSNIIEQCMILRLPTIYYIWRLSVGFSLHLYSWYQGDVLYPVLFSLYIDSRVDIVHFCSSGCDNSCIYACSWLYANYNVLLASIYAYQLADAILWVPVKMSWAFLKWNANVWQIITTELYIGLNIVDI